MERFEDKDRSPKRSRLLNGENMGKSVGNPLDRADQQDDGIIQPADTRDVLGLGLELAAEEKASRASPVAGGRGEIGADGDSGDWGVFRM